MIGKYVRKCKIRPQYNHESHVWYIYISLIQHSTINYYVKKYSTKLVIKIREFLNM